MTVVEFEVIGSPAAQGSKKHVGNGVMVESSKKLKPWRDSVAGAARDVADHDDVPAPLDGALHLDLTFRFPMPKSRRAAVRRAGQGPKTTAPDLDKLIRAIGDALQAGGLVADDARICSVTARKVEVVGWTGAIVRLTPGEAA